MFLWEAQGLWYTASRAERLPLPRPSRCLSTHTQILRGGGGEAALAMHATRVLQLALVVQMVRPVTMCPVPTRLKEMSSAPPGDGLTYPLSGGLDTVPFSRCRGWDFLYGSVKEARFVPRSTWVRRATSVNAARVPQVTL